MLAGDPAEERLGLRELGGGQRQLRLVEACQEIGEPPAHLGPILDRRAHVAEHALEALAEALEGGVRTLLVDLEVHPGFA